MLPAPASACVHPPDPSAPAHPHFYFYLNPQNVSGPGAAYDDAYFEFNYIRSYTLDGVNMFSTGAANWSAPDAVTTVESVTYQTAAPSASAASTAASGATKKSAGRSLRGGGLVGAAAVAVGVGLVVLAAASG